MTSIESSRPTYRVLLCVAGKKDASVIQNLLSSVDAEGVVCTDIANFDWQVHGNTDAILIDEALLSEQSLEQLTGILQNQPEWSDLAVLFVNAGGVESHLADRAMQALTNVLVLNRPLHLATLASALRMALRGRSRQHRLRELLEERSQRERTLQELAATLEQRVAERTEQAESRAKQLQALAVELLEAEERERRRIAELLHDDLQQLLAAARMQLQWASRRLPFEPILADVIKLLEESTEKTRSLSHELSPAVLHQSGLVAALQWLARQMSVQFGFYVELEADAGEPFEDLASKTFVFRAVQELLFNAVKHAGVKSARVVVTGSDSRLIVSVSDKGQGFDPEVLDTPSAKTGLGLRSVRERASYMGGSLIIESAPAQGSRFTLTVPAGQQKADAFKQPEVARQLRASGRGTGPKKDIRVFLAYDHKVMLQGLSSMIGKQPDIEVVGEAANGREALEGIRKLVPDVVVMDAAMPEMDGVEATRRIMVELPGVRVIGLTMHEEEQIVQAMRQAGAEAVLNKAASLSELLKAIYNIERSKQN